MRRVIICILFAGAVSILSPRSVEAAADVFATHNCDGDGQSGVDLSDVTYLLNWLFLGGPEPVEYRPDGVHPATTILNGDCNGDRDRDVSDPIYLIFWLFAAGEAPVEEPVNEDRDADGVPNSTDNCPEVANADQVDGDQDTVGNVCDNCPTDANPGQEDTDGDLLGDACDPVVPPTYVGSLTAANGRWSYAGQIGIAGANALCNTNWPGSKPCTFDQLLQAETKGELLGAKDTSQIAVKSFWTLDPSRPDGSQCGTNTGPSFPWSYATAHTGVGGAFVNLGLDGKLSAQSSGLACGQSKHVACCNP